MIDIVALNPLVAIGLGIGLGVCALYLLLEMWPVVVLGGAAYIMYKGTQMTNKETVQ